MRGRIRDSKITIAILTPYRAQKDKVVDEIEKVLKTKKGKDVAVPSLFPYNASRNNGIATVLTINESQGEPMPLSVLVYITHTGLLQPGCMLVF